MEMITGLNRTHMCADINEKNIGDRVTLMGWVQKNRNLGSLMFIDLRDRTGIVQIVFDSDLDRDTFNKAETIKSEYVIAIVGRVDRRAAEVVNKNMKTGEIEVKAEELRILSEAKTPPIYIEEDLDANEQIRLKYRYLDLRRPDMHKNILVRHKVAKLTRDFFDEKGFLEIETPMLTKSTPEGARDYLVPSRVQAGKFFALPQSPQIYKQLLMLAGMDRYFQIAKCFRDEDLRADRQPEFTQIDIEMSFIDIQDILNINEQYIVKIFNEILNINIKTPFLRLSYKEAMRRFGSDKPDIRFAMELKDLSDILQESEFRVFADTLEKGGSVCAINVESSSKKISRKDLDKFTDIVKTYKAKGLAWLIVEENEIRSPIAKFLKKDELDKVLDKMNAKPGDIIMIVADKKDIVYDSLGHLRLEVGKKLDLIDENQYRFLWVTDFPLLEYDEDEGRYLAKHHPFTAPMDEDIDLLESNPSKVRAKAYDIILNGVELGGGSIRIHNTELQLKMFKALGFSQEEAWNRFGFLMEAFKYGTPPHGGIAYGLDRLVMLLTKSKSIRDVIAFPKVQNSSELMVGTPSNVDVNQLEQLHIGLNIVT